MKKVLQIVLGSFLLFSVNYGQMLLEENFDYGNSSKPDILTVTTNWTKHSGTQNPQYVYPGLIYPNYPSSNKGGAVSFTSGSNGTTDGDINRTFTDVNTTTTIYVSLMVNVVSAKALSDYFFHLSQNPFSTSTFRGKIFAIDNGGTGWNIGVSKQATSTPTINTTTLLKYGQTYLLVMKYEFNATALTDDVVSLFVYSTGVPASETSPNVLSILNVNDGVNDPLDIGSVGIRQGSNTPTAFIDGIRVAKSWSALFTATDVEESSIPTKYELNQNYPNPFNPSTVINYQLPQAEHVTLKVYDVLGNEVATLVNAFQQAGVHNVKFANEQLSSGIYFYKLQAGSFTATKKMMLAK
jgi:hypothetical protein